ncbi:hypothetical protein GCM10010238_09490 [Streptomyces griseoviridis]|uniref:Uncharacterized protein n=1 Tax=Streptomyces griseoviridis TaxID=45398 RepID=A0A918L9E5_STRGD|nr:hypothetical protein GCM10010238_09490 [Streptomyces niveoruber]
MSDAESEAFLKRAAGGSPGEVRPARGAGVRGAPGGGGPGRPGRRVVAAGYAGAGAGSSG